MSKNPANLYLLIVSQDVIDGHMAGPGVRYLEMARSLSSLLHVSLAVPSGSDPKIDGVQFFCYAGDKKLIKAASLAADIVLVSGAMVWQFPFLFTSRARVVVDLYDPILLENLYYHGDKSRDIQGKLNAVEVETLNLLAQLGDYFICGSERQRDLWMGVLAANERINPVTIENDQDLRGLIDVVGMGLPARAPEGKLFLRGQHAAVPSDARIVLWGGGIWNWLDPLTLIHAWKSVLIQIPQARLIFLGTRHPNPAVPQHQMATEAVKLAENIGELGKSILFFEWLSIQEREALLCEADLGVVCQPKSLEARYALRTRVLDYFWARLPVVTSSGDVLSEVVSDYGVGRIVPPGDADALAKALIETLSEPKGHWREAFDVLHTRYSWERQVRPLLNFCLQGGYAADRQVRKRPLALSWGGRVMRVMRRLTQRLKPGDGS